LRLPAPDEKASLLFENQRLRWGYDISDRLCRSGARKQHEADSDKEDKTWSNFNGVFHVVLPRSYNTRSETEGFSGNGHHSSLCPSNQLEKSHRTDLPIIQNWKRSYASAQLNVAIQRLWEALFGASSKVDTI